MSGPLRPWSKVYHEWWTSSKWRDLPFWAPGFVCAMLCWSDDEGYIKGDLGWLRDLFMSRLKPTRVHQKGEKREVGVTQGCKKEPFDTLRAPTTDTIRCVLDALVCRKMLLTKVVNDVTYYGFTNFDLYQQPRARVRGENRREEKRNEPLLSYQRPAEKKTPEPVAPDEVVKNAAARFRAARGEAAAKRLAAAEVEYSGSGDEARESLPGSPVPDSRRAKAQARAERRRKGAGD